MDAFVRGHVPNNHHCTCLSNKSLSYYWVASVFETLCICIKTYISEGGYLDIMRWTIHAGHCWRRMDDLISDVLLWTPSYGQAKAGRPARNCMQQLCEDMGCSPEDLPEARNDWEEWRERARDIRAGSAARHEEDDEWKHLLKASPVGWECPGYGTK